MAARTLAHNPALASFFRQWHRVIVTGGGSMPIDYLVAAVVVHFLDTLLFTTAS